MTSNTIHGTVSIALTFAALLGPAHAGVEKDAKDQLAASAKTSLKTFKQLMKAREQQLEQVLDGIDLEIDNATATLSDAYALNQALADFQLAVKDDFYDAYDNIATGLHQAMSLLDGAGVDDADYPSGFRYGEPGPLDDFRFGLDQLLTDRYEKLRSRLGKLGKRMGQKAGIGLTVRIVPPVAARERSPSAFSMGSSSVAVDLTIDLLVAFSDLSTDNDGVIFASGSAYAGSNLTLSRGDATGFNNYFDIIANSEDRWSYQLTGVNEQNYRFRITPQSNGAYAHSAIGVR